MNVKREGSCTTWYRVSKEDCVHRVCVLNVRRLGDGGSAGSIFSLGVDSVD